MGIEITEEERRHHLPFTAKFDDGSEIRTALNLSHTEYGSSTSTQRKAMMRDRALLEYKNRQAPVVEAPVETKRETRQRLRRELAESKRQEAFLLEALADADDEPDE